MTGQNFSKNIFMIWQIKRKKKKIPIIKIVSIDWYTKKYYSCKKEKFCLLFIYLHAGILSSNGCYVGRCPSPCGGNSSISSMPKQPMDTLDRKREWPSKLTCMLKVRESRFVGSYRSRQIVWNNSKLIQEINIPVVTYYGTWV